MALDQTKSYYNVAQTGSAGEARGLCHRHAFTAAPISALNDELQFFKVARGFQPISGSLELSAVDAGAGGTVSVILTDGTTTYELIKDADATVADHIPFAIGGDNDWLGQYVDNDNDWYIAVQVTTVFGSAAATGHYALSVVFTTNPTPNTF